MGMDAGLSNRLIVLMSPAEKRKLARAAQQQNRSMGNFARMAIERYISYLEAPPLERTVEELLTKQRGRES